MSNGFLWVLVGSFEFLWVFFKKKIPLEPIRTYYNPLPTRTHLNSLVRLERLGKLGNLVIISLSLNSLNSLNSLISLYQERESINESIIIVMGSFGFWWVLVGSFGFLWVFLKNTHQNLLEPIRTHPIRTHQNLSEPTPH